MKLVTTLFALLISGSAMAQDGFRLSTDNHTYREVAGTRQDGVLYGTGGFVKSGDRYGLRLAIGPSYATETYQVGLLYAVGVLTAEKKGLGGAMWHEAEATMRFHFVGLSIGRSYDNDQQVQCEARSGQIGTGYYARVSLNFQIGK